MFGPGAGRVALDYDGDERPLGAAAGLDQPIGKVAASPKVWG